MALIFQSNRLSETLNRVREQHPIRKGKDLTIGRSIIDQVRTLLEGCSHNDISELAYRFDAKQLLACIEIIVMDKDGLTAENAAKVVRLRPRNSGIIRGWFKLVRYYPNSLLERLLKEMLEVKGFEAIVNVPNISAKAPMWFFSSDIVTGVLKDHQSNEVLVPIDTFLESNHIKPGDGLHRAAWQSLLTRGKPACLKRETDEWILDHWELTIETEICIKMGQHYLNSFKSIDMWSEVLLEYIYKKWDAPIRMNDNQSRESRFWQEVDSSAKREFRRWLFLREVEQFFEGERADFWRPYVENSKVQDVQQILSGSGFMLHFGSFGVVEFKNIGNAAHIYPRHDFEQYWRGAKYWSNNTSHFKDISKTMKDHKQPNWDGRILHHKGWQTKANTLIRKLLIQT